MDAKIFTRLGQLEMPFGIEPAQSLAERIRACREYIGLH
jgi:hypothetical protein